MQVFSFTIFVKEDITEEQANKLYKVAPDATCGACCGQAYVQFDREGTFEVTTIKSAMDQLIDIGLTIKEVK